MEELMGAIIFSIFSLLRWWRERSLESISRSSLRTACDPFTSSRTAPLGVLAPGSHGTEMRPSGWRKMTVTDSELYMTAPKWEHSGSSTLTTFIQLSQKRNVFLINVLY